MNVSDVMTSEVVTVPRGAPLPAVAALMLEHAIGGLPVVDEGTLVGIVCRSDVLPFEEDPDRHLRTAGDVMSRDVVSVPPSMTVGKAASVLAHRGIKRAPVLDGEALAGIVSESDLLRPFGRNDEAVARAVESALSAPATGTHLSPVDVTVQDGVVRLRGRARGEAQHALILRIARAVDGVSRVEDELIVEQEHLHSFERISG